ncbi:hypothetical protein [Lentzea sp. NPDC051838]|uniref:hypothetical protein n=1 Tax=Lentzea sp. NPDC051838 TaxID=3154849 RepID=UPI00341C36C8
MGIPRRAVLLGGVGLLGAGATYGALTPRGRRLLGWTGPDGVVPDVPGVPVQPTPWGAWMGTDGPTVLALHGRGGSVQWWQNLGLPQFLAGVKFRCAVVAGTDDYWVNLKPPVPFEAAIGISMGGFGVLDIASRQPLKAVSAISPALFHTWDDARRIAGITSEEIWARHEPLRHTDSIKSPVGVWCGREDPFYDGARDMAEAIGAAGSLDHGEHTDGYWRRVLPEALKFIENRL